MKVAIVNQSDINGGAARAAYRIHHALLQSGLDSQMYVNDAAAGDYTVNGPSSKLSKGLAMLRPRIGGLARLLLHTSNPILHSPALIPSYWLSRLNHLDADLLHLHWVNGEMMSISDIGHIQKPTVWTLHDMWAFCGAEHYTEDSRWRDGYSGINRPRYDSGFDLNRWTWNRKCKHWKRPIHIVTPSSWLAECVADSALMREWPLSIVPNAIDTDVWQPVEGNLARQLMHLPADVPLLLFGAMGGANDPRKGFDLLKDALSLLRGQVPGLELVIFGQREPRLSEDLGFPVHYTGHLYDDISLRLLYSAADAMVIPSRQDNLPNTGVEAHACGRAVVAFDACGLPDIVEHKKTGYLAKAYDAEDLAAGLEWVLSDLPRCAALGKAGRERALRLWSNDVVVPQYLNVYSNAIDACNYT